ncbi:hypothetical protein J6590_079533 [Homalodisca vitripennis]|nr:hypothetical protein J6590_079533 [Homalodisca vitripennis]
MYCTCHFSVFIYEYNLLDLEIRAVVFEVSGVRKRRKSCCLEGFRVRKRRKSCCLGGLRSKKEEEELLFWKFPV